MLIFNTDPFGDCFPVDRVLGALETDTSSHSQEFTDQMQKAQLKKQDHRDTVSQGMVGSRGFLGEIQKAPEAEREAAAFRPC